MQSFSERASERAHGKIWRNVLEKMESGLWSLQVSPSVASRKTRHGCDSVQHSLPFFARQTRSHDAVRAKWYGFMVLYCNRR